MSVVGLFKALGDETRLEIVKRLSTKKPFTLTTLSQGLQLTRQGVRKHLQILEDAHLVVLKVEGRDTFVLLDQKTLLKAKAFIAHLEKEWEMRLESLKNFVEKDN